MSTVITVETLFGASNTDILDVLNGEGEAAAAAALAAASANAKPMPAIHANNKVKPADPAAPMGIDALFADLTLNEKDTKDMEEAEFIIPDLVVRGHISAYPAPPNGGKTALFTHLGGVMADNGEDVFYFNVDSPPDSLKRQEAHARKHGYRVICPDAKVGKSIADAYIALRKLAEGTDRLDRVVLIIDTLKKFIAMLNKDIASDFYKMLRKITARGATICLLSHTNKYKDVEGKLIFEGTGDHRADTDDMVYLVSSKDENTGILEVTTCPDKVRAIFAPRSFRIHTMGGLRVEECNGVLNLYGPDEKLVLNILNDVLKTGAMIQKDLVPVLIDHTPFGRDKVRAILYELSTGEDAPIGVSRGAKNSLSLFLKP